MNGLEPTFDEDELVDLVLGVALGQISKDDITAFFTEQSRPLPA
jgi:hypothetical protein